MKTKYTLILEIEGENLYEIADGVTKVAADFLISRLIENKDQIIKTHSAPPPGVGMNIVGDPKVNDNHSQLDKKSPK